MYIFTYTRGLWPFRRVLHNVVGHSYDTATDKMWIVFSNGHAREIIRWKECEVTLGADWAAFADSFTGRIGKPALAVKGNAP